MIERELNGAQYVVTSKLSTFAQLHLARKLGPAIPLIEGLTSDSNKGKDKGILAVLMFSHIPDADVDHITRVCLATVFRVQDGKRVRITTSDGELMFDDISMNDMLELTIEVVDWNLGDFFRTALAGLPQMQATPEVG